MTTTEWLAVCCAVALVIWVLVLLARIRWDKSLRRKP
jgi:hypothetical protein